MTTQLPLAAATTCCHKACLGNFDFETKQFQEWVACQPLLPQKGQEALTNACCFLAPFDFEGRKNKQQIVDFLIATNVMEQFFVVLMPLHKMHLNEFFSHCSRGLQQQLKNVIFLTFCPSWIVQQGDFFCL